MKYMKIGILTFHRATNYGAILQAYALVSYLKNLGYEAKIIDYKPEGMASLFRPINASSIIQKVKRILINIYMIPSLKKRWLRRKMFWKYIEHTLSMTNKVKTDIDMPQMDAYIVGSDQVWSVCFTNGLDKLYWGKFDRKGGKMISYAGSAAENMNESFYSNNNFQQLEFFDSISVREEELQMYLQSKLPNKEIYKTLDPTLMVGISYFEHLIKDLVPLERPYVLIYQMIRKKDALIQEYTKEIAKSMGCDIVEIKNFKLYITKENNVFISKELIDPSMFVSLFKYAKYVITTSFHGTAFSLLFNRPFNVISVSPEVDSRAKDLLQQLNMEGRMIELPASANLEVINWDIVNNRLEELRKPSINFLLKALN